MADIVESFEAWWATSPRRNRELIGYSDKKCLAFDAFCAGHEPASVMREEAAKGGACRTCRGMGGVHEDMGDGQYVGAECPICHGHGFSEETEDAVWSAIMEAQGPDSNARDYARAALLALANAQMVMTAAIRNLSLPDAARTL